MCNRVPLTNLEMYKNNVNKRAKTKWYTKYSPKQSIMKNFLPYRSLDLFYLLPKEIQECKHTTFKNKLKLYCKSTDIGTFDTFD